MNEDLTHAQKNVYNAVMHSAKRLRERNGLAPDAPCTVRLHKMTYESVERLGLIEALKEQNISFEIIPPPASRII